MAIAVTAIAARAVANTGRSGYFLLVDADDPFGRALTDLDHVLDVNVERIALIKRRIAEIRQQHSDGLSYTEIVEAAQSPLLVQVITESRRTLDGCGARVRRAEALALHNEGMTMEEIAGRFGVTRQRVSALLREARRDPADT
jgi:DNA-directed RNA polymerase sigma subunit (sigma70/sigma32)